MYKLRFWMSIEQEERFINKYANRGFSLEHITPFRLMPPLECRLYKFSSSTEKRVYKIDTRNFEKAEDETDYLQLMQDDGWTYFKGNYAFNNWFRNYYWSKTIVTGNEDIFSDLESKLESENSLYSRLLLFSLVLLGIYLLFLPHAQVDSTRTLSFVALLFKNWYPIILSLIALSAVIGKLIITRKRKTHSSMI